MAQLVKNPTVCELWVQSLGWEDPGEEGMATHLDILAWRISMNRGAWLAAVHGGRKELATKHRTYIICKKSCFFSEVNNQYCDLLSF